MSLSTSEAATPLVDLVVKTSPKGTRYVTAFNLHSALRLDPMQYSRDVEQWLTEDYGFADDIRQPIYGEEYASISASVVDPAGNLAKDYFIRLNLAKLITLNSSSPVKKEFARYLLTLEKQVEDADLLTPEQVAALIELVKVMGLISCQKVAERKHFDTFTKQGGSSFDWFKHRANLLGFNTESLRAAMLKVGRNAARRNHRQMLLQTDKYQTVRAGVIDLFAALGKTDRYAHNMGALAYKFAAEMKVAIWNDEGIPLDFTQSMNQDLIREVKALKSKGFMGLW